MKIALYCRVSTDRQSHDLQLAELREYCHRRGWSDITEYTDTISGSKFSRQGLDSMLKLVRKGKIDAVLCFRLDRLGRSLAHLAQLLGEFTSNRVALIVPAQAIDTSGSNPAATLQLNILAAIAQFERELIRERVLAGIAAAKARGVRFGRPASTSKHLPAVGRLLAAGKSTREIARELKIPKSSAAALTMQIRKGQAPTIKD
jgi:DNA invertase Pin-like site-specific DNA recombinase